MYIYIYIKIIIKWLYFYRKQNGKYFKVKVNAPKKVSLKEFDNARN